MSQAVMEKASELGHLITETEEFYEVKEKQSKMFKNSAAMELLKSYDALKKQQKEKQEKGEKITGEDMKALEQAEIKLSENPIIKEFFEAQNKFQEMLNKAIELVVKPCKEK